MTTDIELLRRANDLNRKANAVAATILDELIHLRDIAPTRCGRCFLP